MEKKTVKELLDDGMNLSDKVNHYTLLLEDIIRELEKRELSEEEKEYLEDIKHY
ncbi:MAG TPA: hypothetical protein VIS27_02980 [Yeosuana sp.]